MDWIMERQKTKKAITLPERVAMQLRVLRGDIDLTDDFVAHNDSFKALPLKMRLAIRLQRFFMRGYARMMACRLDYIRKTYADAGIGGKKGAK